MLRFLFLIFLLWLGEEVAGQGVVIRKSADIIVVRGKSYYLHTVEPGQTLYSICKAYEVDVEEVKALNGKKDNNLSLYEVLKVPYAEPYVERDEKYYYHKVGKGETLYSISRDYGIKPKRLLKFNEGYQDKPLAVGTVIKIPLSEIDASALKAKKEETALVIPKEEKKGEPERKEEVKTIEVLTPVKKTETIQETVTTYREPVDEKESQEIPSYISEVVMPADPYVKIALLLPFSAKDYPRYIDSLSISSVSISARSEQFVSFYEGILLAVDSLRNAGRKIDLHVYDTERNADKMYDIAREVKLFAPDLIIGPVYGSVYKAFAENLDKTTVPVIYPLSSRSENFGKYPNFVQVNTASNTLVNTMVAWLKKQSALANIIHVNVGSEDDTDYKLLPKSLHEIHGVKSFTWDVADHPLNTLRSMLLPDRENIIVIPSSKEAEISNVLPLLTALTDSYRITVVGLPEWQTFNSVDHETYFKLNTKIFTYSYIDYTSPAAKSLLEKYRKYFFTEPQSLVFKAYDMGIYFIELASKFRDRTLDAIEYYPAEGAFSKFRFEKMNGQEGKENHGLFIVNFGSDYRLKIQSL